MLEVKNREALIKNGKSRLDREARRVALSAIEEVLRAVNPTDLLKSKVSLNGDVLKVEGFEFNLKDYGRIIVVGGGKASGVMARALEFLLGNRISSGLINVPCESESMKSSVVRFQEAGHPIPNGSGMKGARWMLDLVGQVGKDDLVICLISGGGSSLMPLPRGDISLDEKGRVTDSLLKSGATINEINTVRKHISDFKGGWLAKKAYPSTVLNLILSDVLGDPLEFIASGPTVPDSTTFDDAIAVLKRYSLWDSIPRSVRKLLVDGRDGVVEETPKEGDKVFERVYNVVIGNNRSATMAACSLFHKAGIAPLLLTTSLEGEARHVGTVLASIAKEIEISGNPLSRPCSIVAGGETTVTVVGNGRGGRNQEIALSSALGIAGIDGVVVASFGTDGVDGPTDAAGALVDGKTIARAEELKLDARKYLADNDSYTYFSELEDLIFTGSTMTNVNDVSLIITTR